ncbi:MAG TPA: hypothetical protein VG297_06190 [Bryobacteraceae bacterium]|jgi:hypothetical protein|nr:hypothetical protein [Bryobacteraceae bacterium]
MPIKKKQAASSKPKPVVRKNRTTETAAPSPRAISESTALTGPRDAGQISWDDLPSYFDKAALTRTHELIADAVAEMLTCGGHDEEVDAMIRAAMAHTRRRFFGRLIDDKAKLGATIENFNPDAFSEWKTDLMIAWRKNEWPGPPQIECGSISALIRANFREALKGSFDNFIASASPEEIRLLWAVLNNWDGRNHLPERRYDEIYLGHAFEYELGRNRCYIRVPERMVDQVEKYVDALRAVEDKAVS